MLDTLFMPLSSQGAVQNAQAAFYSAGAVAVVVGGLVALRRFGMEQPYGASWEVVPPTTCTVRLREPQPVAYEYNASALIVNKSKSRQTISRFWMTLNARGDPEPTDALLRRLDSVEEIVGFFGHEGHAPALGSLAPGEAVRVLAGVDHESLLHTLTLYVAFEYAERRLWSWGVHPNKKTRFAGIPAQVGLAVLEFYGAAMTSALP